MTAVQCMCKVFFIVYVVTDKLRFGIANMFPNKEAEEEANK